MMEMGVGGMQQGIEFARTRRNPSILSSQANYHHSNAHTWMRSSVSPCTMAT